MTGKNKPSQNKRSKRPRRNNKTVRDFQVALTSIVPSPSRVNTIRRIYRTIDKAMVTSTSIANGLYGYNFQFQEVTDVASFQATFDHYMIEKVDFEIRACSLRQAPSTTSSLCYLAAAVDFDSSAAPATATDILQYENCIVLLPEESRTMTFVPHILLDVDQAGATAGATKSRQWIDLSDITVPHYGVRLIVKQNTSTSQHYWYILARYQIALRSSR